MNNLIEAVRQYQRDKKISDNQFSQLLGLDRSTWAYIKSGKRNPGIKFFRAIARELPQFKSLIYEEITDTLPQKSPQMHQEAQGWGLKKFYRELLGWLKKRAWLGRS